MATKKNRKTEAQPSVFVYLGPSVRGLVQHAQIYSGTEEEVRKKLRLAAERIPAIMTLLVRPVEVRDALASIRAGRGPFAAAYRQIENACKK